MNELSAFTFSYYMGWRSVRTRINNYQKRALPKHSSFAISVIAPRTGNGTLDMSRQHYFCRIDKYDYKFVIFNTKRKNVI